MNDVLGDASLSERRAPRREVCMNDVLVGAKLGFARLLSASALALLALAAIALFAAAVLERRAASASAMDDVLCGIVFGVTLPLLAYLVSERASAGQRLERSVDSVARYGADRRRAVLGLLLASGVVSALASALLAVLGVLGAHSAADSGLAFDLRSSIGIALVSGFSYALFFGAASALGRRGGGRLWALVADFALGRGASALAIPYPRAHVRNLLGGSPVLDLPQSSAWLALFAVSLASIAISVVWTTE